MAEHTVMCYDRGFNEGIGSYKMIEILSIFSF